MNKTELSFQAAGKRVDDARKNAAAAKAEVAEAEEEMRLLMRKK